MAFARSEIVDPEKTGTYHCWSRCVRRAFLCGFDKLTGKNYDHRKEWVEDRLKELTEIFAIDILAYAIMDSHSHLMLRNYPEISFGWSDEEVAGRWFKLFPRYRNEDGTPKEPKEQEIFELVQDQERIKKLRLRLCDISWFMRCLNEQIARRANIEDKVTGRFWEGRFKCTRLDDDASTLSCMVYIDLNPIRAGKAETPEESVFTSAYKRICARQAPSEKKELKDKNEIFQKNDDTWLCSIEDIFSKHSNLNLEEYLTTLDITGRELAKGKRGKIPDNLKPILERISIKPEHWLKTSSQFGRMFPRVSGSAQKMREAAEAAGKKWFKGMSFATRVF